MSTVYVDTSALRTRVVPEPQSVAVVDALRAHVARGDLVTSSSLAWVELARALRRARAVTPLDPDLALAHAVSGSPSYTRTRGRSRRRWAPQRPAATPATGAGDEDRVRRQDQQRDHGSEDAQEVDVAVWVVGHAAAVREARGARVRTAPATTRAAARTFQTRS